MSDNSSTSCDATMIIGGIIKEAIGPLPKICQESVLRDLECARMFAEDLKGQLYNKEEERICTLAKIDEAHDLISDARTWVRGIIEVESRSDVHRTLRNTVSILNDADYVLIGSDEEGEEDASMTDRDD